MTNNERFNAAINACCHPRLVLNAFKALAPVICAARSEQERRELIKAIEKGGDKE